MRSVYRLNDANIGWRWKQFPPLQNKTFALHGVSTVSCIHCPTSGFVSGGGMGRVVPESLDSSMSARRRMKSTQVVAVGGDCEERFFELRLAHQLPTVDLKRTLAGTLLSPAHYEWFVGVARNKHDLISRVTRIFSLLYLGILFFRSPLVREYITYALFLSVVPLIFVAGLLSLDVIAALVKTSYEYWFLSLLNAIHWFFIALVYHDVRSFMCLASWISIQMALTLDANFRTFAAASKTVGSAIPGMILLGMLCVMRYVADGHNAVLHYRHFMYSSGDVVSFTASTLGIFMTKLAVRKHLSKGGLSSLDSAIVYCVMIKARLELDEIDSGENRERRSAPSHRRLAPSRGVPSSPSSSTDSPNLSLMRSARLFRD